MRILLCVFSILQIGTAFAQQHVFMRPVSSGIHPESVAGVSFEQIRVHMEQVRRGQPQIAGVQEVLHGIDEGLRRVLNSGSPSYEGHTVFLLEGNDLLLARYSIGDRRPATSVFALDTPAFTIVLIPTSEDLFRDASSVQTFLEQLIQWNNLPLGLTTTVSFDAKTHVFLGQSMTWILPSITARATLYVLGCRIGPQFFVMLQLGKRVFEEFYPRDAMYVSERFPPLRERARSYSRVQLWAAIGDKGDSNPLSPREEILMEELFRRGVSETEFRSLLFPGKTRAAALVFRVDRLIRALIATGRARDYAPFLTKLLSDLPPSDLESAQVVGSVFTRLVRQEGIDLSGVACQFLTKRSFIQESLAYLSTRGNTQADYKCVSNSSVPADFSLEKESALRDIRERLPKQR